jgi:hypothetical protein
MTQTSEPLYNLVYDNHLTNHMAAVELGITRHAARQRARLWCTFMSANGGRGVVYTLEAWTASEDDYGAFERAAVYTGPECVGTFTIRTVTK